MPRFGRDGKRIAQRTPETGPPRDLPRAIDGWPSASVSWMTSATAWKAT